MFFPCLGGRKTDTLGQFFEAQWHWIGSWRWHLARRDRQIFGDDTYDGEARRSRLDMAARTIVIDLSTLTRESRRGKRKYVDSAISRMKEIKHLD